MLTAVSSWSQVREGGELTVIDGTSGLQPVALNFNVATTISFPGEVTLVTGYGLVADMKGVENFSATSKISVVHFQVVAKDTLVLRMLRPGTPCFMTVRTTEGFFLLKGEDREEANLAVIVTNGDPSKQSRPVTPEMVTERRIQYEPMAMIGILSRAKERAFLENVNPELYQGWEERNNISLVSTSRGAEITIYEIQRWPDKDALIFRCIINNLNGKAFRYDPRVAEVRVGDRVYPVQLADGPPEIGSGKKAALDLVLMGNPTGGKEHLAISNDFRVELPDSPPIPSLSSALFPADAKNPIPSGKEVVMPTK